MKKILLSLLILCSMNSVGYAASQDIKELQSAHDLNIPIFINKSKKSFSFTLPSNPTTGYSWFIANYDHNLLKVKSYNYIKPTTNAVGAGGKERWVFTIKPIAYSAPHVTEIKLINIRPWVMKDSPKTAVVQLITK